MVKRSRPTPGGRRVFSALLILGPVFLAPAEVWGQSGEPDPRTEVWLGAGGSWGAVGLDLDTGTTDFSDPVASWDLGVGVARSFGSEGRHAVGMALDLTEADGDLLMGFRLADYTYAWSERWRTGGFLGVARLDTGAPALGWYLGLRITRRDLLPGWDLEGYGRYGDKLARDRLLAGDPPVQGANDLFYDVIQGGVRLIWRPWR